MNQGSNSTFVVNYINIFGEYGGFEFSLDVIEKKEQVHPDFLAQLIYLLRGCLDNLVGPFIIKHGRQIISFISDHILNDQKENLRSLDKNSLGNFLETL